MEHQASFHFAEQLQPGFSCLLSSGSDFVLYSNFLCYVSGSSSRISQCITSPALQPWRRPVEANHLVSLACSLCGGLFIAHSSWSIERRNARNYETKTSSSYFDVEWFPYSLVRGRISAHVDRCLHDRKQPHTPHKSCRTPLSVQLWVNKLSKSRQHFLNLLVKEKQLWQVNVLSPSMPLYGTLSLFRTSSAGCYAFPCVSLGSDVSTCKPYACFRVFARCAKKKIFNSFTSFSHWKWFIFKTHFKNEKATTPFSW